MVIVGNVVEGQMKSCVLQLDRTRQNTETTQMADLVAAECLGRCLSPPMQLHSGFGIRSCAICGILMEMTASAIWEGREMSFVLSQITGLSTTGMTRTEDQEGVECLGDWSPHEATNAIALCRWFNCRWFSCS